MKVVVLLILVMLQTPISTHYVSESGAIFIESTVFEQYEQFPLFEYDEAPRGYTLYDLSEIILVSVSFILISHSIEGAATFEFTRFEDGEPLFSYYLNPTLDVPATVYLDWHLPVVFEENATHYTAGVPNFELEITAFFESGENATVRIVTEWTLVWIQRQELVPQVIQVLDMVIQVVIIDGIMLIFLFFIRRRNRKQDSQELLDKIQEERKVERRKRKHPK